MIYIDGDSCIYGSGIEQHVYGFTKFYTGRENKERFMNGKIQKANVKMNDIRKKSRKITDDHVEFIEANNVAAQLRKRGVESYTRAAGGSSNQAICMRIIEAVIQDNIKTVIFCPTNFQRILYPKLNSQSLTFGSGEFNKEYETYLKNWIRHFSSSQTMYLEANALLGLINFCKDNNVELLGTKTANYVHGYTTTTLMSPQIQKIVDQINELCIFDLGSDFDDDEKRIFTECGHPNLGQHIKLAEDICTHLKT
jgi:hypothetical protein